VCGSLREERELSGVERRVCVGECVMKLVREKAIQRGGDLGALYQETQRPRYMSTLKMTRTMPRYVTWHRLKQEDAETYTRPVATSHKDKFCSMDLFSQVPNQLPTSGFCNTWPR
jgi:hypothetical protein